MPTNFTRPTRRQILARVQADIEGEVDGVSAQVRRRPEFGLAVGLTGAADSLHAHLAWVAEQIIVDQAAERFLLRWADLFGLARNPATAAGGTITVTGSGGTLPATTEWIRVSDGMSFATDADHTITTTAPVAITAADGFEGIAGNLSTGTKLQLVSPIAGVDSEATVLATFTGGTDQETLPALLVRLLDRIQRPPLGGAPGDHAVWAEEVSFVDTAWEYAGRDGNGNPGVGKVAVTFVLAPDTNGDIVVPDVDQVAEVQAYLDARSPAEVIVFAPDRYVLNWHVIPAPDTPAIRLAITAEVKAMLARDVEPGGTIRKSRFEEAVSAATGEVSHSTDTPAADLALDFGVVAVAGTPNYT
jgi:uncharacterized phage protein gp47/JayE